MSKKPSDKCPEHHEDCFAFSRSGVCKACVATNFRHRKPCPFYKTALERKRGHLKAIERLENLGRYDLIKKFGETPDQAKVWDEI